ncbi:hypothetical protein HanRHA438_Chr16g0767761 [Helianthus annuus]|nr:hypothetical protein HanRHA438_Chr16g0767761 [Helianthus annuus]
MTCWGSRWSDASDARAGSPGVYCFDFAYLLSRLDLDIGIVLPQSYVRVCAETQIRNDPLTNHDQENRKISEKRRWK